MSSNELKWSARIASAITFYNVLGLVVAHIAANKIQGFGEDNPELAALLQGPVILIWGALMAGAAIWLLYYSRIAIVFLILNHLGGVTNLAGLATTPLLGKWAMLLLIYGWTAFLVFKHHMALAGEGSAPSKAVFGQPNSLTQRELSPVAHWYMVSFVACAIFQGALSLVSSFYQHSLLISDVGAVLYLAMTVVTLVVYMIYRRSAPALIPVLAGVFILKAFLCALALGGLPEEVRNALDQNSNLLYTTLTVQFAWYKIANSSLTLVQLAIAVLLLWQMTTTPPSNGAGSPPGGRSSAGKFGRW